MYFVELCETKHFSKHYHAFVLIPMIALLCFVVK